MNKEEQWASPWREEVTLPCFDSAPEELRTDVLIIGGGIAGLLTAYFLKEAGVDCLLIEAETVCSGVTGNTTAKITVGHGLIYDKLRRRFSLDDAGRYLSANREALLEYKRLAKQFPCDLEEKENVVYSLSEAAKIEKELRTLEQLGYPAVYHQTVPLPLKIAGAVGYPGQAQFHPLKFLAGLAAGLPIYEHTRALEFDDRGVRTNRGRIFAKNIVVATHFPILNKHGGYFLKLHQRRAYVAAYEGAANVGGMYIGEKEGDLSFRNAGKYLLIGGGSHRTGTKNEGFEKITRFASIHYPEATLRRRFATQDCISLDGMPYVGRYSAKRGKPGYPSLYVATGFNKWGMTTSMAAAMLLRDFLLGKDSPYADLFSPSRSVLHLQLLCNGGEAILSYITPRRPRCPHLGCALRRNPLENSYDCPCHGSRFTKDGRLLDGPATGSKKRL